MTLPPPSACVLVGLCLAGVLCATTAPGHARNWGSVDFKLASEGMSAAAHALDACDTPATYRRLRDGEILTSAESFLVVEDTLDDEAVLRVEIDRHDDATGDVVRHEVILDGHTLRPLESRKRLPGVQAWEEITYGRDEASVTAPGAETRHLRIRSDTVEFLAAQLLFLKFLDDDDRMRFSFVFDDVMYHFHANLKETETVILGSSTYETIHVVCKMRGTWYHLAPALHFWIEAAPPHRLVRYQSRREVVELVE